MVNQTYLLHLQLQTFILFTYGEMVNRPMEIDWVKYFKCKKCWEVKPLNKCYFHINTMFSTGFSSKCKNCVKEERESKPKVKYITRAELEEENKKLREENDKLNLHIEAKDTAYMKLLKDYEELKESSKYKEETLTNAIWEIFNKLTNNL